MKSHGFTLVELVVIIILIGILSVVALPRSFNRADYESRGFLDETRSLLRYAQKQAIAQRRTVCVTLNATGVSLRIADVAGATACNTTLGLAAPPPRRDRSGTFGGAVQLLQFRRYRPECRCHCQYRRRQQYDHR